MTTADVDLGSLGRDLVERLGGRWSGRGGLCLCPAHDDRSPSLSIRVGDYGLFYHCFAGCATNDVLRAVRSLDARALATGAVHTMPAEHDRGRFLDRLRALWGEGVPVHASPAMLYLRMRGLDGAGQGLRFHGRVPLGAGRDVVFRPAILAAVQEGQTLLALHRTFLAPDGARLAPDLTPARRMLGRPGRGAVRFGPATTTLGIAEGLETAISAMRLLRVPVWAVLGNERLPRITIPSGVLRLLILADDDSAGRRSAALAAEAHATPGRSVIRLWPGRGHNDWNDKLRAGGKRAGSRVR